MRHSLIELVAALDFGGSSVKIGLVDRQGVIHAKGKVGLSPRSPKRGAPADDFGRIMERVLHAVRSLLEGLPFGRALVAAGAGIPGFTDKVTGTVLGGCPNIRTLEGRNVQGYLHDSLGVPAFVDNDATCAAAGELAFGAGRSFRDFLLVTIGTGIGGGLVLGGKVFRGSRGFAGEIGHLCVDTDGMPCPCGSRGCLELYASGPAMVRRYEEGLPGSGRNGCSGQSGRARRGFVRTAKDLAQLARKGDRRAGECIQEAADRIARAFAIVLTLLDLQAFLVGGGVSEAGDILLDPVRRRIPSYCWPAISEGVEVLPAGLSTDAGILGAAAQALERLGNASPSSSAPESRARRAGKPQRHATSIDS